MAEDQYKKSGIDIDENDLANDMIKGLIPSTFNKNVVSGLEGLFSAGYRLDRNKGNFIGQRFVTIFHKNDLEGNIRHTLNEIEDEGAEPLFLTDYIAFGKLDAFNATGIVLDIMKSSRGIPLIGGEVAEMPGVIRHNGSEVVVAITYQTDQQKGGLVDISKSKGNILTTSIDSVGTKTKLGWQLGRLENLFSDMLGHSIGDTIVQSATPLGIAMYLGHSRDFNDEEMSDYYSGTIEDSGLTDLGFLSHLRTCYRKEQFDIVGSTLGIMNEEKMLTGRRIKQNDLLIGWKSFGVNTNGYSLIRRLGDTDKIDYNEQMPETSLTVGEALMQPHEDYRSAMEDAKLRFGPYLKGAAHITGGGIEANTKRLLPEGFAVSIEDLPHNPVFNYLQKHGNISEKDMNKTFNRGIGLVFVVDEDCNNLQKLPENNYHFIGRVIKK